MSYDLYNKMSNLYINNKLIDKYFITINKNYLDGVFEGPPGSRSRTLSPILNYSFNF